MDSSGATNLVKRVNTLYVSNMHIFLDTFTNMSVEADYCFLYYSISTHRLPDTHDKGSDPFPGYGIFPCIHFSIHFHFFFFL